MRNLHFPILILIITFILIPVFSHGYSTFAAIELIDLEASEVSNPASILVLVNKENYLPKDFIPEDLRKVKLPNVGWNDQLEEIAAASLESMFRDAKMAGHILFIRSGYRSYSTQHQIFYGYVKKYSRTKAETFSAPPGMSEHQTGLAIDICSKGTNYALLKKFGELEEGMWVKENSWKYGFIIRYPENKTHITKYTYEPWHLRYVGQRAAKEIYKKGLTLEEYLDSIKWKEDTFGAINQPPIWVASKAIMPLFA